MSSHNDLAFRAGRRLLADLRGGTAAWSRPDLTPAIARSSWFESWPRPDLTYADPDTKRSVAVEFKPPGHGKREYITGLGQCLTYLNGFDYSLLILPAVAGDGFPIAEYLADTVEREPLDRVPLGLLVYDTDPGSTLTSLIDLREPVTAAGSTMIPRRPSFWAYWRDLSNYDLYDLLNLVDRRGKFPAAWNHFWKSKLSTGKARTWEGSHRKTYGNTAQGAQRLNTELSMRHTALIDDEGRLTFSGLALLQTGKVYGPDSQVFLDELAQRVLIDGRHIELIYWFNEIQPSIDPSQGATARDFYSAIDERLIDEGLIREPAGTAKPTFIRDEPKLWNKLGLLRKRTATGYFFPQEGLRFDWRHITGILAEA